MKRKTIFVALCVFFCLATHAISGEAIGSDKIKAMLLRPDGWLVEWRGTSYEGVGHSIFEDRGENIVVKISNPSFNTSCERNVTITSDVIKFDGCSDTNIVLQFDPKDQEYPFKGESETTNYKLKAK